MVGLKTSDKTIPRHDSAVLRGGEEIGRVTSGTWSFFLNQGVAMASLETDKGGPGDNVELDVRGRRGRGRGRRASHLPRVGQVADRVQELKAGGSSGGEEVHGVDGSGSCAKVTARLSGSPTSPSRSSATLSFWNCPQGPSYTPGNLRSRRIGEGRERSLFAGRREHHWVNDKLATHPELINSDPYGDGWIIKLQLEGEPAGLLSESGTTNPPRRTTVPYLVHSPEDRAAMLASIGVGSMEPLLADIPAELRIRRLDLPDGLSEPETMGSIQSLAARNRVFADRLTFRGGGVYRRFIPAAVAAVTSKASSTPPTPPIRRRPARAPCRRSSSSRR